MRILLINNSPVVGKLVTLSAQKTGDELVVIDNIKKVPSKEFNLLLIDDEFFNEAALEKITSKASFDKKVLIADRGTKTPPAFSMTLEKPFLPTDLVEILLNINSGKKISSDRNSTFTDETLDYNDTLDDALTSDALGDELIDELDGFDDDDDLDLDLLGDSQHEPSILDKNDISEVKELLEDESFTNDLGDDLDLTDDFDLEEAEAALGGDDDLLGGDDDLLGETTEAAAELDLGDDDFLGDDDLLGGDDDLLGGDDDLLGGDDDLLGGDDDLLGETTEAAAELDLGDDDLLGETFDMGEDLSVQDEEEISISGNDDLLSDMESESLDVDLDDDLLSDAHSMLDDDPLADEGVEIDLNGDDDLLGNTELDEEDHHDDILGMGSTDDILNELMGDDDSSIEDELAQLTEGISELEAQQNENKEPDLVVGGGEFASLTEEALSEALGESDDTESLTSADFASESPTAVDKAKNISVDANPEMLKMILNSLDNDKLKEALKGMNISINISFDEKK